MENLIGEELTEETNLKLRLREAMRDRRNLYRTIAEQNKIILELENDTINHNLAFLILVVVAICSYGLILLSAGSKNSI